MEKRWMLPDPKIQRPPINADRLKPLHEDVKLDINPTVEFAYATPDGRYLAILVGKKVEIWSVYLNLRLFSSETYFRKAHDARALNGTQDSKIILFQNLQRQVVQWDCQKKQPVFKFTHDEFVFDIVTNKNTQFWSSTKSCFYLWDLNKKQCLIKHKQKEPGLSFLYLAENFLYSNTLDGPLYAFDLNKGGLGQEKKEFGFAAHAIHHMAFSPDLKQIAYSVLKGKGEEFRIANTQTKKILYSKGLPHRFTGLYFTTDGKYLIVTYLNTCYLLDLKTFQQPQIAHFPILVTSCNRRAFGMVIDGIYYEWSEKAVRYLEQEYWERMVR